MCVQQTDVVLISDQIPGPEILALAGQPSCDSQGTRIIVLSASHGMEERARAAGTFTVVSPWDSVERLRAQIRNGSHQRIS